MSVEQTHHRRVAVVTSSRADYGHVYWPMRSMLDREDIQPELLVTGAHLSPEFGMTVREIERDGFPIAERIECLLSSDTDAAMGKTIGLATILFTDSLDRHRPDLLLVVADRYEMLAPALAAMTLRIPTAHIEGGELSIGAIDQQIRNALTMLSHIHLVTTKQARQRLIQMGEEPWRIHRVGTASLDHLHRSTLLDRKSLEQRLDMRLSSPVVILGLHPVTIERETTLEVDSVLAALRSLDATIVFCYPNADAGGRSIIERARNFCEEHPRAKLFVNLDHGTYWSLLRCADAMIGNSSSGIMESSSLGIPAVDIGKRQQGRECAANVIHSPPDSNTISAAIERVLSPTFRESVHDVVNPYGDGLAAERIADVLANVTLGRRLMEKPGKSDHEVISTV